MENNGKKYESDDQIINSMTAQGKNRKRKDSVRTNRLSEF